MKVFLTTVLLTITCIALGQPNTQQQNAVIKDFLSLRFGMFIHYNMSAYFNGEQWAITLATTPSLHNNRMCASC